MLLIKHILYLVDQSFNYSHEAMVHQMKMFLGGKIIKMISNAK